jgi:sugar phosphate isomerase/epimerase
MTTRYRLGTTSYIVAADLLDNVVHLAGRVDDIELILFEVDDGPSNLPDEAAVARLRELAAASRLTYTVHLPLDIRLGDIDAPDHPSLTKAAAVIDRLRPVAPHAYVLHLEGRDVLAGAVPRARWLARTVAALEILAHHAGGAAALAVENLEGYPLDFLDPVLERVPVSACVDIGHLWLEGHDALAYLRSRIERTRIIHLHGIGTRDHQSLAHVPHERLRALRELLDETRYDGVVTLEVFNAHDLETSMAAFAAAAPACERMLDG